MPQAIQEEGDTLVHGFFDGRDWRAVYQEWLVSRGLDLHWRLLDLYKSKLQATGYREVKRDDEVGDEPLMRNARKNAPFTVCFLPVSTPLAINSGTQ